ncbi:MAG: SDR family oxidoreductase [Chitinophagales bacterium]
MNFEQKTVWITGASSGIGEALAYAFSAKGATILLSARNETELNRVKQHCVFPERVHVFPLDIANYNQAFETGANILKQFGQVDILVNNAGISQRSQAVGTIFEVDEKLINTNFLGTVAVTKSVLNKMVASRSGIIVVVTSVVGKIGTPFRSSYAASKHALHGFFDSLRAEISDSGVRVLLVCPGFVRTSVSINALTAAGTRQGTMDEATDKGLSPDYVAEKIIQGICNNKEEIWVTGFKERFAINLKRFFPIIFSKLIKRSKVT